MADQIMAPMFMDDTPDLEEGDPLLPESNYTFEITKASSKVSKKGDRNIIYLRSKVVGPEGSPVLGTVIGDRWNVPNQADVDKDPKARIFKFWKAVASVRPAGVTKKGVDADRLLGLRYAGAVTHEEYQGVKRNRINWPAPMKPDQSAVAAGASRGDDPDDDDEFGVP